MTILTSKCGQTRITSPTYYTVHKKQMTLFQENAPHIYIRAFQTVVHVRLPGSKRNLGNLKKKEKIYIYNCTIQIVLNVLK